MEGQKVAHYHIQKQLGKGGMGIVYLATDTRLDRKVALKFLPPELSADEDAKARFVQEAKAASALDHPNICTVHEIGESFDGKLFIAMTYYDGQTLKYVMDDGAMPESLAVSIALQVADGLRTAHNAGITHRDIKPANIILTSDHRIKILDFGLAKLGQGIDLTKAGSTVGTTAYMSPEQSSGQDVDGRTDIWSLGVILYELLAGRRAFGGGYDQAVLYSVMNEDPPRLEKVDPGLADVVEQMLRKKPEERLGSAEAVLAALDPFSSGTTHVAVASTAAKSDAYKWAIPVSVLAVLFALWTLLGPDSGSTAETDSPLEDNLIAVLPFSIQGSSDMQDLSESMVIILGTLLDGAGDIYTVDHAAIIEQSRMRGPDIMGPSAAQEFVTPFNAGHFVLGSIVRAGNENQITARLYNADGTSAGESSATYTGDEDFMGAVDVLAAGLIRGLLNNPDQDLSSLAAETTESFQALKYYLEAEPLVRGGRHPEAYELINKALALDSTFALAWYLRAETQAWIDVLGGTMVADLKMAKKYESDLSGRARRILNAEISFQEGNASEAEALYKAILRDYPNDLEATGQLAEVYVHYSPREDKQLEALRLFDKVAQMTPGSQQFSFHHSDLLALKGLLTGSFHGLDSLAAVYADLPVPEVAESLDWSLALDRMNPETRSNMVKSARLSGSPEDSVASFNIPHNQFATVQLWAYGLIDDAEASARVLEPEEFESGYQPALHRGRGQFVAARSFLAGDDLKSDPDWLDFILEAALPAYQISADSLRRLEEMVQQTPSINSMTKQEWGKTKLYLMAQLAFSRKNYEAFDSWVEQYFEMESPDHVTWNHLGHELKALQHWLTGNIEVALAEMQQALPEGIYFLDGTTLSSRQQPNWYLAQMYEQSGQLEEAISWYNSNIGRTVHAPIGRENAARLYEQLGDTKNAIRYYTLMVDQWKDADPFLQPRVQAARDRIEALLDEQAREPR